MKFLCEHCKAKYQIADDKVAGRTVRMKCRKCGGQIEVRAAVTETSVAMKAADVGGDATDPGKAPLARPPTRTSSPLARPPTQAPHSAPPGKHGQKDGPLAGAFQRNVQRDEDATAAGLDLRELSAADEWYVAVNGVPVGPVRVGEVRRKAAMGAVTEDSLCWQEGMEEWRAIRTVTELAAVVREAASGGRASLLPSEPRAAPPGRPPPPKQRPSRSPSAPAAPAAPAWSKPSTGPLAQGHTQPQTHRPFDDLDEGQPTVVGRSALLDEELAAPAPSPWTNGTNGASASADPFGVAAPDPFKAAPPPPSPFAPQAPAPAPSGPAVGAVAEGAAVAAQPAPLSVAPAPKPAKPMNPMVLGMMVMFGCFGAVAAWFTFGQPKPAPAPVASAVATAAPTTPTAAPTDIPPPVASSAAVAPASAVDAGPAKVASSAGTHPSNTTSTASGTPSSTKATAATDPALRDLINGAGTGPAASPGGPGAGGGPKLTEDDVRGVVMQKQTQLKRTCWEKSGSTVPSVNVLVHIVVNGSGAVTSASATGNDPVVGHCLETQIKQWHWPGGGEVDVPFHFLRQ